MSDNFRTLKPSELRELHSLVSPVTAVMRWSLFSLLFFPLTFLFYKVNVFLVRGIGSYVWLILALVLAWWLLKKFNQWSGGSEFRAAVKKDISQGEVHEIKHLVQRCLMFPEDEDEGNSYVIENCDGEAFFFSGQELPKKFPKNEVTVITAPHSSYMFRISTKGDLIDCSVSSVGIFAQRNILNEVRDETYAKIRFKFEDILRGAEGVND